MIIIPRMILDSSWLQKRPLHNLGEAKRKQRNYTLQLLSKKTLISIYGVYIQREYKYKFGI